VGLTALGGSSPSARTLHHPKAVAERVRVMGAEGYVEYGRDRYGRVDKWAAGGRGLP
jgi:hypothetical protein